MGRASTFSDPRVIDTLQRDFIPVAVNVAHLVPEEPERRNWGESSKFVEAIVRKSGMRTRQRGDAQGYYALSAAGDFYGGLNTHDIDKVFAMMSKGSAAQTFITDYYRQDSPFARASKGTVSVEVRSIVASSDKTFEVEWTETTRDPQGAVQGTET